MIIQNKGTTLFITDKDGIAPIGWRLKHGMNLDDGRWLYELEAERHEYSPALVQKWEPVIIIE